MRLRLLPLLLLSALAALAAVEPLPGLDFGKLVPREVRVFLPPGGVQADTPLLVALDGQNMAQWKLEETIAALAADHRITPPLVVAITAGPNRLDEYGLAGLPDYAGRGARAAEFEQFVLTQVLPAVRARYHLATDRARTGVMGASLGGLSAFDLGWRHPDIFGFAGIFSGSFWWRGENGPVAVQVSSRLAHRLVRETITPPSHVRFWFENGSADETDDRDHNGVIDAIQDTQELMDALAARGLPRGPDLVYVEIPGGRHHESTWAQALPGFLTWALPAR